ncbi:MAG: threonylcarbamoyl-AMP synthase [Oscillospiraceae bacterium]|nr:threonylcarbamoyl-AMP synthase [Oscillospiraceae bacterium]
MVTKKIKIDSQKATPELLNDAAEIIRSGGLVAFPTETVYGLGADAFNEEAVKKIYKAKGRPSDNPMIVHIADKGDILNVCSEVPPAARLLMEKFSPGPITYILKKNKSVNDTVTAGLDTVAVRIPSDNTARALIKAAGVPIAAPSANLSGKPSPTRAAHVSEDMDGRIECIIDGGDCDIGVESTVIDMTGEFPVILRPGGITIEMIKEYIPSAVENTRLTGDIPKSPGMKYRHYAPNASVTVVEGDKRDAVLKKICSLCEENGGKRIGVILRDKTEFPICADFILYAGRTGSEYASKLFALLRECDDKNAELVIAETDRSEGINTAVRNRIYKSAADNVIQVF